MNENNIINQSIEESRIDFIEWVIAIGKEKITILIITFIFSITSILYSLFVTPTFTAKTIFVPNNQQQNTVSTNMSVISNISGLSNQKTQEDYYISLLQSDNLQNEVIKKLNLQHFFRSDKLVDARQKLKSTYRLTIDKKAGFIILEADSNDPDFSAKLANAFVDELANLLGRISLDSAKQRLQFFEKAISKTQIELADAKAKFQGTNEKSGVLSSSNLTENIYSQINAKELQISAMSHFSTAQNPDIRRVEAELTALRNQLFHSDDKLVKSKESETSDQSAVNTYREIKSLELILGSLTSQYKASLTEAFSTDPFIQRIEVATPPERRSKPQRTLIVIYYSLLGLVIGLVIAIIKIQLFKMAEDSQLSSKFIRLKQNWLHF